MSAPRELQTQLGPRGCTSNRAAKRLKMLRFVALMSLPGRQAPLRRKPGSLMVEFTPKSLMWLWPICTFFVILGSPTR